MTVLVAVEHRGTVVMGADSYCGDDVARDLMDRPKFWRTGDVLIGCAGDLRSAQVARTCVFRERRKRETVDAYILEAVVEKIRAAHKAHDAGGEDFSALIAYAGHAYMLDPEYAFVRSLYGYATAGAGADFASGSLSSTQDEEPQVRVEKALRSAERHCSFVSAPFHFATVR